MRCSAWKLRATGLTSRASNTSIFAPADTNRSRIDAFGLFTGQIGYAWNNALLYVKGGAAVTDSRYDIRSVAAGTFLGGTGDQTRWGGTVGAGIEYGFAPNWSAALEYDHLFMGNKNVAFNTVPACRGSTTSARTSTSSPSA